MTGNTFDRFQPRDRGRFGDNETAPERVVKTRLADVTVAIHHETPKALLVSHDGLEEKAVWLPRAVVEIERKAGRVTGTRKNGARVSLATATVTMPASFAQEKGLI